MRVLLALAVLTCAVVVSAVTFAVPFGDNSWPDESGGEVVLARFGVTDATAYAATTCARYEDFGAGDLNCNNASSRLPMSRAFTITRVDAAVLQTPWLTTEACDVAVHIDGTAQATTLFEFGGDTGNGAPADLNAAEETHTIGALSIAVAAGEVITVEHNEPADATNCVAGAGCECSAVTGATASHMVTIYGRF